MSQIIPLISSGLAGPLGVLHLPRFWQKASLAAVGKDHPDYPAGAPGYDQMTMDALELDHDEVFKFINENKPTYTQFELWILNQKGGSLDQAAVAAHNEAVIGYQHKDATRENILASVGIADTGAILDAVNLNNLEDWQDFHKLTIAE